MLHQKPAWRARKTWGRVRLTPSTPHAERSYTERTRSTLHPQAGDGSQGKGEAGHPAFTTLLHTHKYTHKIHLSLCFFLKEKEKLHDDLG